MTPNKPTTLRDELIAQKWKDGEYKNAVRFANFLLDEPYRDPDSPESTLARQFNRSVERLDHAIDLLTSHSTELLSKETCTYCKKPVNQMIQPWNYLFPAQIFHLGCQQPVRSTELLSKIKEIGHQQEDDTIWCEMDKVIEIINQESVQISGDGEYFKKGEDVYKKNSKGEWDFINQEK